MDRPWKIDGRIDGVGVMDRWVRVGRNLDWMDDCERNSLGHWLGAAWSERWCVNLRECFVGCSERETLWEKLIQCPKLYGFVCLYILFVSFFCLFVIFLSRLMI